MRFFRNVVDLAGFSHWVSRANTYVGAIIVAGVIGACSGTTPPAGAGGAAAYVSPEGGMSGGTTADRTWSTDTSTWTGIGGFGGSGGTSSIVGGAPSNIGGSEQIGGSTLSLAVDTIANLGGRSATGGAHSTSTSNAGGSFVSSGGKATGGTTESAGSGGSNWGGVSSTNKSATGGIVAAGGTFGSGGSATGGTTESAGSGGSNWGGVSSTNKSATGGIVGAVGGTLGSGGVAPLGVGGEGAATGGANTGGQSTMGDSDAGTGGAAVDFSFFAFGDIHVGQGQSALDNFKTALAQAATIDPHADAAFANGDLTDDAKPENWALFDGVVKASMFHKEVPVVQGQARFFGNLGNHDLGLPIPRSDWLTQWNLQFPAQVSLGHNGTDGVYYSLQFGNVLFIMLDSQHPSVTQTLWLEALLDSEQAQESEVKIALFHQPVYSCSSTHGPFADGVAWVDLFERYGVRLALVSHLHTYDRTCPMLGGKCSNTNGVTYVNLGPLGATNYRSDDRNALEVNGTDAGGTPRTDKFTCSGTGKIIESSRSNINDFCRVQVNGCRVSGGCYQVGAANLTPFDTWHVDMCGP